MGRNMSLEKVSRSCEEESEITESSLESCRSTYYHVAMLFAMLQPILAGT